MSRRVTGGVLVLASALLGVPHSYGDATPVSPLLPLATCEFRVNDGPNDGVPKWSVVASSSAPTVADPRGNVPALDIKGITLRLTATRVYAFMSVADIPTTFREPDSAYAFVMWFTYGAKVARFDQVYANPTQQAQGLAPASGPLAQVGTTAGGSALTGTGGGIDTTNDVAYVYADRAALETALGGPLNDGDELTVVNGRTELWETKGDVQPGLVRRPADTTEVTGDAATWHVGDDRCFPQSKVAVPNVTVEYGDTTALVATLTDTAGAALAGKSVTFTVPGETAPRTLTTDEHGVVRIALAAAPVAKAYPFTVKYVGDDATGAGKATGTLTVRPESIRIAPLKVAKSGTARIVTATLTEDDPRAFAGQPVAWYVNGKKVATVTTDSAGRSVFKGAKAGQKVQARYAGQSGCYAAAVSNTVTA